MNLLQKLETQYIKGLEREIPDFRAGDTVRVDVKIREGNKERFQAFEGLCIARRSAGAGSSFRVRKLLSGEWIERLFPLYSPLIRITLVRRGIVRRAKLYYLRGRQGKSARIRERIVYTKKVKAQPQATAPDPKPVSDAGTDGA